MRALAILIVLGATAALGGTTDDAIPDSRYLDYASGFAPYTAFVSGLEAADGRLFYATGVAIHDRYVVTAAHVASEAGTCLVTVNAKTTRITRIFVHAEWQPGHMGLNDIAIMQTAEPIGLAWYPPLSDGGESPGDVCQIAGFGITGRISTGYTAADGKLRAGTQTISRMEGGVIVCLISGGSSPLEYGIAPGDSGGPLFVGGKLAGINSFTMADRGPLKSKAGEESGHTRVSLHREWIAGIVGGD
jgi:secreted trypsin-like serine protease